MSDAVTREEHLAWCKERAREYLELGDIERAITSMLSDLSKHSETRAPSALAMLGMIYIMNGSLADARRFIEGFR